VADRETSHYHIFKRRIVELGYCWTETPDPDFEERLQVGVGKELCNFSDGRSARPDSGSFRRQKRVLW
jgi:hypothetical protein